ncbi:phosphopantetheine adenylyltransferase [Pseudomonas saliphila]|uniref:phosphopantetheine adenylyltransferase n=1 Tax=Pseudomonas saliphila TaxID=2586906 RepID=UPI0012393EC4|nr:phosphopantetheine adenylyltransferase [Pseudomonas saliphila]
MERVITGLLVLVGIIHLLPVSGVLGPESLAALYGVSLDEPNLEILMRHRAVLFGLLGLFLIYAAFRPAMQLLAIGAGFVSVVSFILIAWSVGGFNEAIRRVVLADVVAAVALVVAVAVYVVCRDGRRLVR